MPTFVFEKHCASLMDEEEDSGNGPKRDEAVIGESLWGVERSSMEEVEAEDMVESGTEGLE